MDNAHLNWLLSLYKSGACGLGEVPTSGADKSQARSSAKSPEPKRPKVGPFGAYAPTMTSATAAQADGASVQSASYIKAMAAVSAVKKEIKKWNELDENIIANHTSQDGIVNHYSLFSALYLEYPMHFAAFRQYSTCLPTEANTERVFSNAHELSDPNMHASNLAMATFIRYNLKNYPVSVDKVREKWITKFGSKSLQSIVSLCHTIDSYQSPIIVTVVLCGICGMSSLIW